MAVLGLGLAALGRPGYMTLSHHEDFASIEAMAMEAQAHAVLDAAYAGGLRHVDAARSYGRAEAFVHSWLEARGHRDVVVSSKWGYRYTAGWDPNAKVHEVKDHSLAHLDAQWAESRAVLGDALRVYQVHSATLESGVLNDGAVLDRLATLRDSGTAMGLSVTGPRQGEVIDAAIGLERGGRRLFDWVQATWNVLEPSAGPALARAKARGLRTIAKEGLANGLLSARGQLPAWLALARSVDAAPDALALAVALSQPFLDVVLSGAATVEQLRSNLNARKARVPDPAGFALSPAEYWSQRARLRWT
ncbi:MAG: aldo/keto reductase [Archangium sp.]|nr:aldo/keto reductase [Archangium sp.]